MTHSVQACQIHGQREIVGGLAISRSLRHVFRRSLRFPFDRKRPVWLSGEAHRSALALRRKELNWRERRSPIALLAAVVDRQEEMLSMHVKEEKKKNANRSVWNFVFSPSFRSFASRIAHFIVRASVSIKCDGYRFKASFRDRSKPLFSPFFF